MFGKWHSRCHSTNYVQDIELSTEDKINEYVLPLLPHGVHSQMDDKKFKYGHKNYMLPGFLATVIFLVMSSLHEPSFRVKFIGAPH